MSDTPPLILFSFGNYKAAPFKFSSCCFVSYKAHASVKSDIDLKHSALRP